MPNAHSPQSTNSLLDGLRELDRCMGRISAAREGAEIVAATRDYLESWPKDRIALVQTVDAGWAPFDEHQRPERVCEPSDVRRVSHALQAHCLALKAAGVDVPPEFHGLDLLFFFARKRLEGFDAAAPRPTSRPQAARALSSPHAR